MANAQFKNISLAIREMSVGTVWDVIFPLSQLSNYHIGMIINGRKGVEDQNTYTLLVGMKFSAAVKEGDMKILNKLNINLPHDAALSLLGV